MTVCVCVSVCERRASVCDPGRGGRPEMGADEVVKQSGGAQDLQLENTAAGGDHTSWNLATLKEHELWNQTCWLHDRISFPLLLHKLSPN